MSSPAGRTSPSHPDAPGPVELTAASQKFLKALANPTRQRIMLLFFRGAELSVGEVAERAGVGQPTASVHLDQLREGGILTSRRSGKSVLYRSDHTGISRALVDLQAYLEVCC
ncbi:MAG: metalloregulator ArsR/SmtB family transcription factor [Streptosporangiales bacterium]|nr:metalloregulator ArsR/SmtB family transcription factor [Streptosporangiales bacterium]